MKRPDHARFYYHLLTHLDLGRDAANLYDRSRDEPTPLWVAPLSRAYRESANRLLLQILPLLVDDLGTLKKLLERGIPPLNDAPGRALRYHLLKAIDTEHARYVATVDAEPREDIAHLLPRLRELRARLWTPEAPPPLEIWDCPALRAKDFTHARATRRQDRYVVAVAIDAPEDELLIQILHEDTHPLTDPPIRAAFQNIAQETHAESDGFKLHIALEKAAVQADQELFEAHAPELLPAYERWRKRFGMA